MTRWIAVVLVAACSKSDDRSIPDKQGGSAAPVDAAVVREPRQEMPAKGAANSAIESVPRKDWPCRYVETLESVDSGGTHIETRWDYGKHTHCWIPADVAGSRGLFGCPDKQVQRNLENKVELKETYIYDSDDHLTAVQTIGARFEYIWDGNLVRGLSLRGEVQPFATTDSGVEVKAGESTMHIEIDKDHHVVKFQRLDSLGFDPTVYTWKGSRLVKLKQIGATKIEYDCKPPPK